MDKPFGFAGTILRVDLTSKNIKKEPINEEVAYKFLGGKGYAAYVMFTETEGGVDPFGPKNKLVFMNGPLTGTKTPLGNRFAVCTKSPLTGTWLDSHCGGFFGPELKFAGYDGIVVEGRASAPSYLFIEDEKAYIRDADWLWNTNTLDTERLLKEKNLGDRMVRVACIGPAGEKMSLLASVIAERRAAGRGGAGAVMGSKNLKAIAVRGHMKPDDFIHNPREFLEAVKVCHRKIAGDAVASPRSKGAKIRGQIREKATWPIQGTGRIIAWVNEAGGLPTRNFQSGMFEKSSEIDGASFSKHLNVPPEAVGMRPCWNCSIMCAHLSIIKAGRWSGIADEGPEYENIVMFGSDCGISDREAITAAEYFCDYYGMDAISVAGTIAFLMECYEKGLITKEDTNGLDLKFGNADALVDAVMIAGTRTGNLGSLIADGSKRAAEKIGKGSKKFAIHVKGMEVPAYEPRAAQGMGLCYARSDRGACHLRPWTAGDEMLSDKPNPTTIEGKAELVRSSCDKVNVISNSSGLCLFLPIGIDEFLPLVTSATGFPYKNASELIRVGERISNLVRAFNVREGFEKRDDTLPYRLLKEPLPSGPCRGEVVKLGPMLAEYYKLCGWDNNGKPTKGKLISLDLNFAVTKTREKP